MQFTCNTVIHSSFFSFTYQFCFVFFFLSVQAAQDPIQPGLEHTQRWGIHNTQSCLSVEKLGEVLQAWKTVTYRKLAAKSESPGQERSFLRLEMIETSGETSPVFQNFKQKSHPG